VVSAGRRGDAGDGETIPPEVRKLARSIMRHVMSRHRRPDLSRISMRLDHRAAELAKPIKATQGGKVGWWINLATMEKGRKIAVPLLTYGHKLHADLNAAANIEARRARPNGVQQHVQVGAVSEVAACQRAEDEDAMPLLLQLPGRRPRNDPIEGP
jgi:hypothetical protein